MVGLSVFSLLLVEVLPQRYWVGITRVELGEYGGHFRVYAQALLCALMCTVMHYKTSKREMAEMKLVQKRDEVLQIMRWKDQFFAKISHELRTPLVRGEVGCVTGDRTACWGSGTSC